MAFASVYPLVTARSVARPFTYEVPDEVGPGTVVQVRFGSTSGARGWWSISPTRLRMASRRRRSRRSWTRLPPALVELALWMADYYGSTPARALDLVAPIKRARRVERAQPAERDALPAKRSRPS